MAMKKAFVLIALAAVALPAPAGAVELNSLMAKPSTPSILYVGFDKLDASGNPVCDSCDKTDEAAEAVRKAQFARRGLPTVMRPQTETVAVAPAAPAPASSAPATADQLPATATSQPDTTVSTSATTTSDVGDGVMRGAMR